jgi:dTDP-4-amino-4,6-dideoxygalactose transaminase
VGKRVYIRLRLDFNRSHFWVGLRALASRERWDDAAERAARAWTPEPDALACLCVRSALDLVLTALALPRGSEVLVSAITIPDMPRVLEMHGLVPVPVDIDIPTLRPRMEAFERARSPRTRAVVVAHLFGGRIDMKPIAEWARRHGLAVIEDAAQAVAHTGDGSPWADATMFSFGPLKTATALGGAILRVPDRALRERIRAIHELWPVQSIATFRGRLAKIGSFAAVQEPRRVRTAVSVFLKLGLATSLDDLIRRGTRGFKPATPDALARALRVRPPVPMLKLLAHRLEHFDTAAIERRAEAGERTMHALGGSVQVAGARQPRRTHWFFGVAQDHPDRTVRRLAEHGVDSVATGKLENLIVVPPAPSRPEIVATDAAHYLSRCILVPVYPQLDDETRARMVEILRDGDASSERVLEGSVACPA